MSSPHVSIAGAGLGGLCLAQALKQSGVDFDVYERDVALASRSQGYRLRIDADGQQALARCLPAPLYALFRQCAIVSQGARLVGRDLSPARALAPERWRSPEQADSERATAPDLCVHRQTLREILLCGIENRVHFGMPFERFHTLADDTVRIEFATGESRTSTLLVGADGMHSRVRAQLVPDAQPTGTDALCIYGKTAATRELRERMGAALCEATSVVFADEFATIIDPMIFPEQPRDIAARVAPGFAQGCQLEPVDDYVYWAFIGSQERLGVGTLPAERDLPALVDALVASWHPCLRALFSPGAATAMTITRVRNAPTPIASWKPGCVTLLGDAIHAMSPAAGAGANTALRDAATLADAISRSTDLREAVSIWEPRMREWATRAVRASVEGTRRLCTSVPLNPKG
ncbi:FAD-dependent oxidoreductase [Paraburkholderia sp.]|uniref:FAD-dependent oxidoreductase n=1 Tax=Paraburkholderia sp. TaxID=1926495 RepID=UPI0039E52D60